MFRIPDHWLNDFSQIVSTKTRRFYIIPWKQTYTYENIYVPKLSDEVREMPVPYFIGGIQIEGQEWKSYYQINQTKK